MYVNAGISEQRTFIHWSYHNTCINITYTGRTAHSDIELKQDFYNVIVLNLPGHRRQNWGARGGA